MIRIIDGKRYNTETATKVADVSGNCQSITDFKFDHTQLYRTTKGAWFIAGKGGPLSRWVRTVGDGYTGGSGIQVLDADEARALLEQHAEASVVEQYFGDHITDA